MQRARSGPNRSPLTVPMPPTRPSAGVLAMRSARSRRRRWAAITSGPYSTNEPSSTRSATFSRAVRRPRSRRRATASGRDSSSPAAWRSIDSARSARTPLGAVVVRLRLVRRVYVRRVDDRFEHDQPVAGHHGRPHADEHVDHAPVLGRRDVVVHLHRLDQHQHRAGAHDVARRHLQRTRPSPAAGCARRSRRHRREP